MKRYFLFCIVSILLISCTIKKQLSDNDLMLIQKALYEQDTATIAKAKIMLDKRIAAFHLKNDYTLKIQLLLTAKEYDVAFDLTKDMMSRVPNDSDMIVLHCVLAKKLLSFDQSYTIYQSALKKLYAMKSKMMEKKDKYDLLCNILILVCFFEDSKTKEECLSDLNELSLSKWEKETIVEINHSTVEELFTMFNIS